jgi:hypothetical protein
MSNFKKLAQLNKIANECIKDGDFELAARVHNEFLKIAQAGTGEYNGPEMQTAVMTVQKMLGVNADGFFGRDTVLQIIKALDGIAPEPSHNKDYVQRARSYVQSLPAGFVTALKNFVGLREEIRQVAGVPPTRRSEEEPSMVKIRLLRALAGYR